MDSLLDCLKEFRNDSKQVSAIRWLQASTGAHRQHQFATEWRNGVSGSLIDFVAVFANYKGLPHQRKAIEWLETTSQTATLREFYRLWELAEQGKAIVLDVPFFAQTDNKIDPHRTCNTSSCAMVAKFLGADIRGDDHYFEYVRKFGDTTDHTAQSRALEAIGIKSQWRTNLGMADLDRSFEAGLPMVLGILHRGTHAAPQGFGHMIVAIGRTANGDIACHDPYGSLLDPGGAYTGDVKNGKGVVYSRSILSRRWTVSSPSDGWGRTFYGNN